MSPVSIKRDIYLYLFGIVLSLTAIYGLMINQSYQIGVNESAKYGFLYELKLAEIEFLATGDVSASPSSTLQVYTQLSQIPEKFIQSFDWDKLENDVIYEEYVTSDANATGEYLYAARHYIESEQRHLYVVSQYDEAIYLDLFTQNPPESISQFNSAFLIIGALLLFVFVLIRLLVHRLTKPIIVLSQWSETLDLNDTDKLAHFRYIEVQTLANQLMTSVQLQRESVERETFFLRAASHELRTPVSIVSASNELLMRTSDSMSKGAQRAVKRIQRSVLTMQNLITSLLWMSRNPTTDLELTGIEVGELVQQALNSHQYLRDGKDLTITVHSTDTVRSLPLPHVLVDIVITNLIRNALQHTEHGSIEITYTEHSVKVTNTLEHASHSSTETSFGIGLILIERLCKHQQWQFNHQQLEGQYMATVDFQGKHGAK